MTETQTVDLASWLTAVWDEEERIARAAANNDGVFSPEWQVRDYAYEGISFWCEPETFGFEDAQTRHVQRHDPASVLARIAADRKILELHKATDGECSTCCGEPYREVYWDGEEETTAWERADLAWPCPTLRLLASPYKGREGWQESWDD